MPGITYCRVDEALVAFEARATGLEEIKPGASFRGYRFDTSYDWEYRIIGLPKRGKDGRLRVKAEMRRPPNTSCVETMLDLADFGLDPDHVEEWDEKEWLTESRVCV